MLTRRAGEKTDQGVSWESDGGGEFAIEMVEQAARGTSITLHLREGQEDLLNGTKLRTIIHKYSDHIVQPILMKKEEWKELIWNIGATEKEFESILPSSISSMQKKTVYGRETSERIYELARLFGLGYQVFDTKEAFRGWLVAPSKALGNKPPFQLLDSSFGFEMVENEILRILYNVYS